MIAPRSSRSPLMPPDAKSLCLSRREANPFEPPERLTVREAFLRYAGIDLYDSLSPDRRAQSGNWLARQTKAAGLRVAADDTWSDMFSRLLSERVEPNLGIGRPTILHDYPASEAALARVSPRRSARGANGSSSIVAASNSPTPSMN